MEINDMKKSLYKENPEAYLSSVSKKGILYYTHLQSTEIIWFLISFEDIGDANFFPEMKAKLLIRWIVNKNAAVA